MTPDIVSEFWKSSYSDQQGDCVEMADTMDGGRAIRDGKNPEAGIQFCSAGAWTVFLEAVKAAELPSA